MLHNFNFSFYIESDSMYEESILSEEEKVETEGKI